jgi:hypothetical protein
MEGTIYWSLCVNAGLQVSGTLLNYNMRAAAPPLGAKWDTGLEAQLCYEIKTFLLAGHETSAAMLTWSVYELSQSAEITQKVREGAPVVSTTINQPMWCSICPANAWFWAACAL